ncbi:MAG: prolyl oligopeptidase family serine peptidase, partial [Verrucomicrobiota bacterium]
MNFRSTIVVLVFCVIAVRVQGETNVVRQIPPPGIAIPNSDRAELERGAAELKNEIDSLHTSLKSKPALLELLPDVEIYHKAVHWALAYDEFYKSNEVVVARDLLKNGKERAANLHEEKAPWTTATGLVVRGYVSKIDGSVQPYGLVIPESWQPNSPHPFRLDFWFHGRGEMLTELDFINGRQKSVGEFTPQNTIVLHLYGRYCNANKFAGETDLFEALADVRKHYLIDENRISVRGFSMGGAACWQFATHYAGLWASAAPGAGFAETPEFVEAFHGEKLVPTWYDKKLWHLYNATDYARNLFNCPTVAYSGELDKQKQAADIMAKALAVDGMQLTHIIGPKTEHKYHPQAKEEINRRIDSIVERGRNPVPNKVRFTTWTLRYNEMFWVKVDGLDQHWERADVDAEIIHPREIKVTTKNVSALTLSMPPGLCPFDNSQKPKVVIDGKELEAPAVFSDRSWTTHFQKDGKKWTVLATEDPRIRTVLHFGWGEATDEPAREDARPTKETKITTATIRKRHGLQGPIDDAFMDSFVMVRPTGQPMNEKIGKWVELELAHATNQWRSMFRGDARVKSDSDISEEDIASSNLILWGDPQSNRLLTRMLLSKNVPQLPIHWDAQNITVGKKTFASEHHAPIYIFPNPLNPKRYVVLNSGFTFREYDYLSNARQVPKLPDYAVVDLNVPISAKA